MTAIETTGEIINVVMGFRPLKIFIPLAIALFSLGLIWSIPFLVAGRGLSGVALLLILSGMLTGMLGLLAEQLASARRFEFPGAGATEIEPSRTEKSV